MTKAKHGCSFCGRPMKITLERAELLHLGKKLFCKKCLEIFNVIPEEVANGIRGLVALDGTRRNH